MGASLAAAHLRLRPRRARPPEARHATAQGYNITADTVQPAAGDQQGEQPEQSPSLDRHGEAA